MSGRGRYNKPYERPAQVGRSDGMWQHDKAPGAKRAAAVSDITAAHPASINSKLVVSNLHYEITPKDLQSIFGQIGTLVREPLLKYDRSGRSIGTAIITYETPAEATRAKKQFEGILAKGQPMSIAYDTYVPKGERRNGAPGSLLNRIEKEPLADRIDDFSNGPGPIRNRPNRRGRGGAGAAGRVNVKKGPKTAEELDKELEEFMVEPDPPAAEAETHTTGATNGDAPQVAAAADGDVEMVA